jgi:cytidyltransferase-like protein
MSVVDVMNPTLPVVGVMNPTLPVVGVMNPTLPVVGVCSLFFNPGHIGHLEYLQKSKSMVDKLIVIVNNDHQAILKKGWSFMNEQDRLIMVKELRCVDEVFLAIDKDPTVIESLKYLATLEPKPTYFLKGGDRILALGNIPEAKICEELGITIIDGMGDKIESSTNLINGCVKTNL